MSGAEILLFSPVLIALLPGIWSFGHTKRMVWTLMVLLLLPVLVIVLGVLILGEFHMAWRCVVWRWCGLCFLAGIAEMFVWAVGYLWREIPGRWPPPAVWLCRLLSLAVIGAACAVFTLFSSFLVVFMADIDVTQEKAGRMVVAQYEYMEEVGYYAYYGPLVRGIELLEGSTDLLR